MRRRMTTMTTTTSVRMIMVWILLSSRQAWFAFLAWDVRVVIFGLQLSSFAMSAYDDDDDNDDWVGRWLVFFIFWYCSLLRTQLVPIVQRKTEPNRTDLITFNCNCRLRYNYDPKALCLLAILLLLRLCVSLLWFKALLVHTLLRACFDWVVPSILSS